MSGSGLGQFVAILFRLVVRIFPAGFRAEYETELLSAGRQWLAENGRSPAGILWSGARLLADTLGAALAARWDDRRRKRLDRSRFNGRAFMFQAFCQDLQFGWRLLTKTPGFSIVAICSLALGMGANTAVFTVFDAILLHSLPVRSPQELVLLNPRRGDDRGTLSYPLLGEFSERQQVFEGVLAAAGADFARTLLDGEFLDGVRAESVSGNFFSVLGIEPALGRLFGSQDDHPGGGSGGPVAIIRHGFWQTQFGASPDVLGRDLSIDGTIYTIIGVAAADFNGTAQENRPDIWVPIQVALGQDMLEWRTGTFFSTLARLKSGVTVEQAEQVSSLLFRQLLQAEVDAGLPTGIRDDRPVEIHRIELPPAAAGFAGLRTAYADPLKVLLALVALVLLVACLNVAGLLLARGRIRHREIAIRLALGSGRFRICRQLLTESLLLAGLATGLGLLIARLFRQLLDPLTVGGSRVDLDLALNSRVLFFTGLCCVFTSLIFGSIPALNAARTRIIGSRSWRRILQFVIAGRNATLEPKRVVPAKTRPSSRMAWPSLC